LNRLPPRYGEKIEKVQNTLLVDGNALFKMGFFGAKDMYNFKAQHIGGLYQFITILRKLLIENLYHRVYVFWDGKYSGKLRYNIYNDYKSDRGKDYINGTQPIDESEILQKKMIWNYLENLCVRQLQHEYVESDDYIGYYCAIKQANENITICTTDRDMYQLISDKVKIYFCDLKTYVDNTNYSSYFSYKPENGALLKTIVGDNSDSIKGIKGLKEGGLLKHFPEFNERVLTLDDIITKAKQIQTQRSEQKQPPLKVLDNIINKVTIGIQGDKIYEINSALVNLKNPLMTEDSIEKLNNLITGQFDADERGLKNVLNKMKLDGMEQAIGSNRYPDYLIPFKQLIEREFKKQNQII
jgi:DNA polymerase-1